MQMRELIPTCRWSRWYRLQIHRQERSWRPEVHPHHLACRAGRYFAVRYMNRKVLCASAKASERSSVIGSENSSERAGYHANDAKIQIRVQNERFTTWDRVAQVVFEPSHLATVASGDSR